MRCRVAPNCRPASSSVRIQDDAEARAPRALLARRNPSISGTHRR
jgi:hypothetical protein